MDKSVLAKAKPMDYNGERTFFGEKTMKIPEKYPVLIMFLGVMGASMSSVFVRLSAAPSAVTAFYRLFWTVLLMSPVVLGKKEVRRELLQVSRRTLCLSCLSGLLLAVHFDTWFESLRHTSVSSGTIIVSTEVIWVALAYCLFMKGRLSRKAVGAIAVTLAGSVVIALSDSSAGGSHLYGDFLALTAALAVAGYTLLGRTVRRQVSASVYTYIVYCACCVSLLALCLAQGHSIVGSPVSGVVCGLLLAVFSTIMGHSIFSWCLKYLSPTFVSAAKLCEPVIASIFAAILFREIPVPTQILGAAVILTGVVSYSVIEMQSRT